MYEVPRVSLSIPGFGPDISSKVLGAIGNPYRFENQSQVLKMAGLDLSRNQTGKSEGIPVISKKGKADLRYGLFQAALVASSLNHHFIRYFTKKLQGRDRSRRPQATGEGDKDEDEGETLGKDAGDCVDLNEKEGDV